MVSGSAVKEDAETELIPKTLTQVETQAVELQTPSALTK